MEIHIMRIAIVGDGKVGSALTEQLAKEGHDIVVIDSNKAVPVSYTHLVPTPATKISTLPSVSFQISGPVVLR